MTAVDQSGTRWSGPRYKQEAAALARRDQRSRWMISLGSVLTVLVIWWLITALELVEPLFVPTIGSVWDSFVSTLTDGYRGRGLLVHLGVSLQRMLVALLVAVALAVPLGVLVGFSRRLEAALEPLINFYRVLPPLAYYPLLIMWMGISEIPKVTLLMLAGFAPLFIAVVQGVRNVSKGRLDAARSLGASDAQVMRYVVLPSILPDVFTGFRVAVGFTYTTLVAAEMVAATVGIGFLVRDAGRYLQSDIVFMGIIVMGITGIALDSLAKYAQRRVVPWQGKG